MWGQSNSFVPVGIEKGFEEADVPPDVNEQFIAN